MAKGVSQSCPKIVPEIVTDQTSAHDELNGYVPHGISFSEAIELRKSNPKKYIEMSYHSMGVHCQAMLDLQYGVRRQVVYNAPAYTPLSLSFLCTDKMDEKRILDEWNNKCVSVTGGFHVEYYDNYVGHLDVYVLDRSGKKRTYHMHYHEVYPKTVTAVELNHGTTNATMRVTAEIQYAYWSTSDIWPPGGQHY